MTRVALLSLFAAFAPIIPLSAQVLLPPVPAAAAVPAAPAPDSNALKWSAESLEVNAKVGEVTVPFTFYVTNTSASVVSITSLRTSCGCTVAQLPPLPVEPFKLRPGSNVSIGVSMDLRGKAGTVTKTVNVDTSSGNKSLLVRVNIPAPTQEVAANSGAAAMGDRAKNIQSALADRQAVFKGECASCHVAKGHGKFGQELYAASCGICHDAEHRAAMVPDLKVPRSSRDLAFWQKWIMEGKPGTMMPAFAQAHGGPLTPEQIDSLTVYLYQNYPKGPQASVVASPATAAPPPPAPVKKLN